MFLISQVLKYSIPFILFNTLVIHFTEGHQAAILPLVMTLLNIKKQISLHSHEKHSGFLHLNFPCAKLHGHTKHFIQSSFILIYATTSYQTDTHFWPWCSSWHCLSAPHSWSCPQGYTLHDLRPSHCPSKAMIQPCLHYVVCAPGMGKEGERWGFGLRWQHV